MTIFKKINCKKIIQRHFKTLVNNNTGKSNLDDWITFFVLPLLAAVGIVIYNKSASANTINLIITALSIFVGLLINVLVLIFSLIQKETTRTLKIEILEETISNISYTIVVSVIAIAFCFFTFIDNNIVQEIVTGIVYFLVGHFFVTLMMIVKRMFLLFVNELDEFKNKSAKVG